MEPVSADDAPTNPEDETSPETRNELSIKVAGWTCVRVHSAVSTTPRHDPPDTDQGNDYDQDGDSEDEEDTSASPQTIISTGICEWEGCDQILRGRDTPALLYHHIIKEHIGKPGDTKHHDPKCRWGTCDYEGKIRRYLVSHILTHVPEYKPLACNECGWRFQRVPGLRTHQKSCKTK